MMNTLSSKRREDKFQSDDGIISRKPTTIKTGGAKKQLITPLECRKRIL